MKSERIGVRSKWLDIFIILGLIALTVSAFHGVAHCGFTNFDDNYYVMENVHVLGGLSWTNFKWAWTTLYQANYLPLTWLSLMTDATLFGPGARGFHTVNLAFHTANALLVFAIFRAMTGSSWRAGLVAALFAIHPLRVESVAWVVERKDVLSGFFGFLALLAYIRYARTLGKWDYSGFAILFAASLLSKQTLCTLPFLLLLLDYWPLGRWIHGPAAIGPVAPPRRSFPILFLEKLPLLAMVAAILLVTRKAQTPVVIGLDRFPLPARLSNIPVSYVRYLGKMFWFENLAVFYPQILWSHIQIAGSCALLLVVSALALLKVRTCPWLMIGWLWFLGTLVPMIGLVQFFDQSIADRFTYVPAIGLSVMVVWSIREKWIRQMPLLAGFAAIIVLGLLWIFTVRQTNYWTNSIALFSHDIVVVGSNPLGEENLGLALAESGDVARGLPHLHAAVRLNPDDALGRLNLATYLMESNNYPAAERHLMVALHLAPNWRATHVVIAQFFVWQQRYDLALVELQRARELGDAVSADDYNICGVVLWRTGKLEEAADQFRAALARQPGHALAADNLKTILPLIAAAHERSAKSGPSTLPAAGAIQ